MKKALHLNRTIRAALLVLMLGAFGAGDVFADGYDYAEVCPSGQMLYYKIDPDDANAVIVVPPYYYHSDGYYAPIFEFWQGYEKPSGDVIIPEILSNGMVVKTIGKTRNTVYDGLLGAFEGCTEITSVVIPNSVTFIDGNAFAGCIGLTSVTIGNSVTKIGLYNEEIMYIYEGPFAGCTSLAFIEFGNSLAFIGHKAFADCTSLTSVTLPNSITMIDDAFRNCSGLASINLPNSLLDISEGAFDGTKWYDEQSDGILYLGTCCMGYKGDKPEGNLSILEGTRVIAGDAFWECEGLSSVTFPHSLTAIGRGAFDYCNSLSSVTIPKSVVYIGRSAFSECSRLTSIYYNAEDAECNQAFGWCSNLATLIIGPDVRNLDGNAFKRCNTVHLVVALGATPAILGPDAFSDLAENAMLMVPCGKKMTYFSQWNMFPYDNILENCDQSPVTMGNIGTGGSITASTTNAQMGEEVQLTITPDAGMTLASISISNANDPAQTIPYYFIGKASGRIGFVMPSFGVSVTAAFRASGASVGENSIPAEAYPNPTTGNVKVEASDLRHVSIFNTLGQQVYDSQADGDIFECDLSGHEAGVYLIRLETAHGIATKRVMLTK